MIHDIEWHPSPAALQRWSFITAGILGCIAALTQALWPGSPRPIVVWVLVCMLVSAGLVGPAVSRPLHRAWLTLACVVATLVGTATLALVYFLVSTPIGGACRLAGRDLLQLKRTSAGSLWTICDARADDAQRQF